MHTGNKLLGQRHQALWVLSQHPNRCCLTSLPVSVQQPLKKQDLSCQRKESPCSFWKMNLPGPSEPILSNLSSQGHWPDNPACLSPQGHCPEDSEQDATSHKDLLLEKFKTAEGPLPGLKGWTCRFSFFPVWSYVARNARVCPIRFGWTWLANYFLQNSALHFCYSILAFFSFCPGSLTRESAAQCRNEQGKPMDIRKKEKKSFCMESTHHFTSFKQYICKIF